MNQQKIFVGVTGGTASGKTTVCHAIKEKIHVDCQVIALDNFYKGLSDEDHANPENYDFDSPNALDFNQAYECLKKLL